MTEQSAGLLAYRPARRGDRADSAGMAGTPPPADGVEVLLVHPGGPYWSRKDAGVWSIAKGLFEPGEDPLDAALREFGEETGFDVAGVARGDAVLALGAARQPSGKTVHVWAIQADLDPTQIKSNTFEMEWPPKSGNMRAFPEVDRAAWFPLAVAGEKILKGQRVFLDRLAAALAAEPGSSSRD